jgi:hypothetical protein
MAHPLEKRITERLETIRQLEAEAEQIRARKAHLEAEVAAYKDALQFVLPKPERQRRTTTISERRIGVNDGWKAMIDALSGKGKRGFSTDDIMAYSDLMDMDMKRATVRAQCANYVKAGYLVRVIDGHFTVTDAGRPAFGLDVPQKETAGGSLGTPTPAALFTSDNGG